eukprot:6711729-Ditylum_brightwellii.AAC.1
MSIVTDDEYEKERNYSTVYESDSTCILHVHDSGKVYGGQTGFVAIKILADEYPSSSHIFRLENEYRVSQYLTDCTSTRSGLKFISREGFHALYRDWAEGITLQEWIKAAHKKEGTAQKSTGSTANGIESDKNFDYDIATRLALEISKAVEEIHQYDAVHNNISSENIIVDIDEGNGSFMVKIIGLGLSSILKTNKDDPNYCRCKQNDIASL